MMKKGNLPLTPEQKNAVGARGKIIVSASAGSGKTAVMIERLISLILEGEDVRHVLAVTFTNKAAAQMRDRLRSALAEKLHSAEGEERRMLKAQLRALPLAEISTIHAFCGRLVRANFFLAGVDATFRIIGTKDAEALALQKRALDEVFDRFYAEKDEDFTYLLSLYFRKKKDAMLRKIVLDAYASVRKSYGYRSLLARFGEDSFPKAYAYLEGRYREEISSIEEGAAMRLAWAKAYDGRKRGNRDTVTKFTEQILFECKALLDGDGLFGMADVARSLAKLPSTPDKTKAKGDDLSNLLFFGGARKRMQEIKGELGGISDMETEKTRCAQADGVARAIGKLVLAFDEAFVRYKREANVLDYDDLQHFAIHVLEDENALARLREKYRYIFVDEYQDVNLLQEKLLSLLAGEEVFLVGDGKQAIYGFRGSNSAFFEQKRRSYRPTGGDLPLTRNFRSASAILDAVNRVFTPLYEGYLPMTGGDRFVRNGETYSGEVQFHMLDKPATKTRGALSVYSVLSGGGEEKEDLAAIRIADIIEAELTKKRFDADKGVEKEITFGDIAVLVRKNSGAVEGIVQELEKRDIPVSAPAEVNICSFFEAKLLIDWLSYLDNAEQDIPLVTAMLSAVGGFSEADLAEIRYAHPTSSAYTFREACFLAAKEKTALGTRVKEFFSCVEVLRTEAQTLPAAQVMGKLLSLGLEAQIAAKPQGGLRLARVRRLISEAETAGGVHAFLARLKMANMELEFENGSGEDAIHVLTMHSSKGLEFPIVILTELEAPFHGARKGDTFWTEQFLLAPRAFDAESRTEYETLTRLASGFVIEDEEAAGEKNLLYVAMTRAIYRLHLIFTPAESNLPAYANRLCDFIPSDICDDYAVDFTPTEGAISRRAFAGGEDREAVEKILSVYRVPYRHQDAVLLPAKSSATEILRSEEHGGEKMKTGHTVEEGLAYHAFLQHAVFGEDGGEELDRMERENLLPPEQLALIDRETAKRILALPCLRALKGKRTWREQTFLIRLPACDVYPTQEKDEVLFQGAIDLLVEDETGFTVVDYKYSSRPDDALKETYAPQIRLYKKAVACTMGVEEGTVKAVIVNIAQGREILL